jgi:thiamine-monophosphate kinase
MASEFDLIKRFFTRATPRAALGIGDDCALLRVPPGSELAVSTDMLVSGVHFFPDARADWLGHKALAANLSDLAAMGATPRWALLALALPAVDEAWLAQFAAGFFALADRFGVELVGGDTTRGPLNICITVGGELPHGTALRRDAAKIGDDIWVTGSLGDAALALAQLRGEIELSAADAATLAERLHQPTPRIEAGQALRGVAHAAIDVSDGLAADLGHILERSGCGASLHLDQVPESAAFKRYDMHTQTSRMRLAGGDDYELCFTAPGAARESITAIARKLSLPMTLVGQIEPQQGLRVLDAGEVVDIGSSGYDHFK